MVALVIALLLSLGVITSPEQATDEMIQQYEVIILDENQM